MRQLVVVQHAGVRLLADEHLSTGAGAGREQVPPLLLAVSDLVRQHDGAAMAMERC
jgi:hypothetical protein